MSRPVHRPLLPCGLAALVWFPGLAHAQVFPGATVPTFENPHGVRADDLNNDGYADVIVASIRFEIFLSDGAGGFTQAFSDLFFSAQRPSSGDIDGDGDSDVVVPGEGLVRVILSDGGGGFAEAPFEIAIAETPNKVELADLDADGDLDYVLTIINSRRVQVIFNSGDGSPVEPDASPFFDFDTIQTIDSTTLISKDAYTDIVVVGTTASEVFLIENEGGGQFSAPVAIPMPDRRRSVFAIDHNSDGVEDLLTTPWSNNDDCTVSLADGVGGLLPASPIVLGAPGNPHVLDLNADGLEDIILTPSAPGQGPSSVLYASPGGGFEVAETLWVGANPSDFSAADINGDGTVDLAVVDATRDRLTAILGRPSGGFAAEQVYTMPEEDGTRVLPFDLDGDGVQEFVATIRDGGSLRIIRASEGELQVPGAGIGIWNPGLAFGDIDGDGDPDLAASSPVVGGRVGWMFNDGTGAFSSYTTTASSGSPAGLRLRDADGDGDLDIVSALPSAGMIGVHENMGDGTFLAERILASASIPYDVEMLDLDLDGVNDLLTIGGGNSAEIGVFRGLGQGEYAAGAFWPTGGGAPYAELPNGFAFIDADQNGFPDIAVPTYDGLSVLLNDGNAAFPLKLRLHAEYELRFLAAADFDRDGDTDIAATEFSRNQIVLFLDRPGLTYEVQTYNLTQVPTALAAVDANIDGWADLVVVGPDARLTVLLNASPGECRADLEPPFGQLDFSDVLAYVLAFAEMRPAADLAVPFDVYNFSDVFAFLVAFEAGCP